MDTKKIQNTKYKKAFSLMELMVVIIILGLLASFVLPSLTGKSEDAKKKITCVQMKSITQALKMYKIDNSSYPPTEENGKSGLQILVDEKYFEDNKLPKDSWGSNYIYTFDEDLYEIISLGGNKKEGGNDDLYYTKDCNK